MSCKHKSKWRVEIGSTTLVRCGKCTELLARTRNTPLSPYEVLVQLSDDLEKAGAPTWRSTDGEVVAPMVTIGDYLEWAHHGGSK